MHHHFVSVCSCQRAVSVNITGEYVEDTEEYINIELDSSRNRLIKLEVVLTAGTFALAIFTLVGGEWHSLTRHGPAVCARADLQLCTPHTAVQLSEAFLTIVVIQPLPAHRYSWGKRDDSSRNHKVRSWLLGGETDRQHLTGCIPYRGFASGAYAGRQ